MNQERGEQLKPGDVNIEMLLGGETVAKLHWGIVPCIPLSHLGSAAGVMLGGFAVGVMRAGVRPSLR
ncbi:unnamed protein product, partial [Bubo scandiacus]